MNGWTTYLLIFCFLTSNYKAINLVSRIGYFICQLQAEWKLLFSLTALMNKPAANAEGRWKLCTQWDEIHHLFELKPNIHLLKINAVKSAGQPSRNQTSAIHEVICWELLSRQQKATWDAHPGMCLCVCRQSGKKGLFPDVFLWTDTLHWFCLLTLCVRGRSVSRRDSSL